MLRTRCPYCSRPFSISREEAGAILAQALAENARYGTRECPFCRRLVKIGLAELRRVVRVSVEAPAHAEIEPEVPAAPASPPEPASEAEAAFPPVEALEKHAASEPAPPMVEAPPLETSVEPSRRRRGKRAKRGGEKGPEEAPPAPE